jgi:ABC-2 type transport system permease protein
LAYPLYSLEGQGFWMIQTGPISKLQVLMTRFGLALLFLLPLGILLGWYSPRVIGLDANLTVISLILGIASAVAAAGIGVGLGAAYPKFDASNPAEVAVGLGGFLYMGITLLHSGGLVVLASRPVYLAITQRETGYIFGPEGMFWLGILVAATVVPAALALWYGYMRMGEK